MTQEKQQQTDPLRGPEENVDRIRDILFGGQMRDYERRFEDLETRLGEENDRLRQVLERRITSLEELVKGELERLTERQLNDRRERQQVVVALERRLDELGGRLDQRLDGLDQTGARERLALRNEIQEQGRTLEEAMRRDSGDLRSRLEEEGRRLQQEKTGREELSGLLNELALRLSGEFRLPDA